MATGGNFARGGGVDWSVHMIKCVVPLLGLECEVPGRHLSRSTAFSPSQTIVEFAPPLHGTIWQPNYLFRSSTDYCQLGIARTMCCPSSYTGTSFQNPGLKSQSRPGCSGTAAGSKRQDWASIQVAWEIWREQVK